MKKWKEVTAYGEKERMAKERERLAKARAKVKAREQNSIAINFACSNLLEKTIRFWRWETGKLVAARKAQAEKVVAEELEFRRDRERVRVKAWEEQKEREEFMRERSGEREKEERKEEAGRYKKELQPTASDLPKFERRELPEVRRPLELLLSSSNNVEEGGEMLAAAAGEKPKEIPEWIVKEMNKKWRVDFTGLEKRIGSVRGELERSREEKGGLKEEAKDEEVKEEEDKEEEEIVESGVDLTSTTGGTEDTDRDGGGWAVEDDMVNFSDPILEEPTVPSAEFSQPETSPASPISPQRSHFEYVDPADAVRTKVEEMEAALRRILSDKQRMKSLGGEEYKQWKLNVRGKVMQIQTKIGQLGGVGGL